MTHLYRLSRLMIAIISQLLCFLFDMTSASCCPLHNFFFIIYYKSRVYFSYFIHRLYLLTLVNKFFWKFFCVKNEGILKIHLIIFIQKINKKPYNSFRGNFMDACKFEKCWMRTDQESWTLLFQKYCILLVELLFSRPI